jgi:E3 ubiquitin-protein ligase HUWE1
MQAFGRTRTGPASPPEATTHPLLLDASASVNRVSSGQSRNSRRNQRTIVTSSTAELLQTIEELIGGGAVQLFQHVISRGRAVGGAPETIRVNVHSGNFINLDRSYLQRRPQGALSAVRVERVPRPSDGRTEGRDFDPLLTLQRWAEEVKILHGGFVTERVSKLADHVTLALLPAAVEAAKIAKEREEQESATRREAQAKAEEEAAAKAREQAERDAKKAEEARKQAEDAARSDSQATAQDLSLSENGPGETEIATPDIDTEMVDAPNIVESPPAAQEESTPPLTTDAEPALTSGPSQSTSGPTSTSHTAARVTVMIHGTPVDITDTGIDPTFLEALPDDMREEVLNQHVRDQRASRIERPPESQISSEFLDALPPEIRAEIIQQERLEQARLRVEVPAREQPATGLPADIDPASFIASLDPQLRQVVLLDQDDGFIQTLPSHMIAEVGGYRDSSQQPRRQPATRTTAPRVANPRKVPAPHDAIQLLDKGGVAVLVRLLFFPQVLRKNLLFKVLVNLCENAKTRTELFNLLLNILQDGTGDLAAVDKSFAQMSFRNSRSPSQQTPKLAGKQKDGMNALVSPNLQHEAVPDLIAHRCLECLTFIVSSNESSSLFFLTEHELPAGLRRAASKKGKGKEKQTPQTHYPIVLLLGLLDRQSLLKMPSTMESVVGLLATVTRPLAHLREAKKEVGPPGPAPPAQSIPPVVSSSSAPEPTELAPEATPTPQQTADGRSLIFLH